MGSLDDLPLSSLLASGASSDFVKSVEGPYGPTYLFRTGPWEAGLQNSPSLLEKYTKARPFGLNSAEKKLKPIQLALLTMSQVRLAFLNYFKKILVRSTHVRLSL